MRRVQRGCEVSKGFVGGCVIHKKLTEVLGNNCFQGLHNALLVNLKILMDREDALMDIYFFFKLKFSIKTNELLFCYLSDSQYL